MDIDDKKAYVAALLEDLEPCLHLGEERAWRILHALLPKITDLGIRDGRQEYEITMSKTANTLAAILCGDHNVAFHTTGGYLQTLPIIGICSAITSCFCPGYALLRIEPDVDFKRGVNFRSAVPVGVPVTMSVSLLSERGDTRILSLDGWYEDEGNKLFFPSRKLAMFKIP